MSLSYIPYVKIDELSSIDLQSLNNTFEKLYVNDLFYYEIDRIAPKIFQYGKKYYPGDCVWYNTEDPEEFVTKSNVHWRVIQDRLAQISDDLTPPEQHFLKADLLRLDQSTNSFKPNPDISQFESYKEFYVDHISAAYDIGHLSGAVQIYQYVGAKDSDGNPVLDPDGNPYPYVKEKFDGSHFYEAGWKSLIGQGTSDDEIRNYVLNLLQSHVKKDSHVLHTSQDQQLEFDDTYLNEDFSNVNDDVCQLNVPNLTYDESKSVNIGFDYVYETVIYKDKWYRLWKSGLLEHGGKITLSEDDLKSLSGLTVPLLWKYKDSNGETHVSKVYTYETSLSSNTNTNLNQSVAQQSDYLIDDANRYSVTYTWCNENDQEDHFYKGVIAEQSDGSVKSTIINHTECNVFNVKNSSFSIPGCAYATPDGGYVSHMHKSLYYYCAGFTRHVYKTGYSSSSDKPVYSDAYYNYLSSSSVEQDGETLNYYQLAGALSAKYFNLYPNVSISSYTDFYDTFNSILRSDLVQSKISGVYEIGQPIASSLWELYGLSSDFSDSVSIKTRTYTFGHDLLPDAGEPDITDSQVSVGAPETSNRQEQIDGKQYYVSSYKRLDTLSGKIDGVAYNQCQLSLLQYDYYYSDGEYTDLVSSVLETTVSSKYSVQSHQTMKSSTTVTETQYDNSTNVIIEDVNVVNSRYADSLISASNIYEYYNAVVYKLAYDKAGKYEEV